MNLPSELKAEKNTLIGNNGSQYSLTKRRTGATDTDPDEVPELAQTIAKSYELIAKTCKTCKHWDHQGQGEGGKFQRCLYIAETTYVMDGKESVPGYLVDGVRTRIAPTDRVLYLDGGHYDGLEFGEDFCCTHHEARAIAAE